MGPILELTSVCVRFVQSRSLVDSSRYSSHLNKLRLPVDSGGGGSGNASQREELEGKEGERSENPVFYPGRNGVEMGDNNFQ